MRTIEKKMLSAIIERKNFSLDNTRVECIYFPHPVDSEDRIIDRCNVYLYNNLIATVTPDDVTVNNCGWRTTTTKSLPVLILAKLARKASNDFAIFCSVFFLISPADITDSLS